MYVWIWMCTEYNGGGYVFIAFLFVHYLLFMHVCVCDYFIPLRHCCLITKQKKLSSCSRLATLTKIKEPNNWADEFGVKIDAAVYVFKSAFTVCLTVLKQQAPCPQCHMRRVSSSSCLLSVPYCCYSCCCWLCANICDCACVCVYVCLYADLSHTKCHMKSKHPHTRATAKSWAISPSHTYTYASLFTWPLPLSPSYFFLVFWQINNAAKISPTLAVNHCMHCDKYLPNRAAWFPNSKESKTLSLLLPLTPRWHENGVSSRRPLLFS